MLHFFTAALSLSCRCIGMSPHASIGSVRIFRLVLIRFKLICIGIGVILVWFTNTQHILVSVISVKTDHISIGIFRCVLVLLGIIWSVSVSGKTFSHVSVSISVRAKSRLCDTMYHTDVILNFRQVFDTEKIVCEMCSL